MMAPEQTHPITRHQRQQANARLGWILAGVALLIYLTGLLVDRG